MERKDVCLKLFLSQSRQSPDQLLRFLPPKKREKIAALPPMQWNGKTISPFEGIHWSWFIPVLERYAPKDQKILTQALNQKAQKSISLSFKWTKLITKSAPVLNAFLRQTLWSGLVGTEDPLPVECLPSSPLNSLLDLDKKKLIHLIDLLSLYDLAIEMRQIVETKILKKIYSFLSEDETRFLKAMTGYKEPHPFPRLDFLHWDGTESQFRIALHKKGLFRLGVALSGQNPDLIWHLSRRLDIGRGKTLLKMCQKEAVPHLSVWVAKQIEELFSHKEKES